ncbi:ras association domain-containing protein 10 [Pempheris klunzingeri]|uniref:ras association domain-containing protein 10 n=1 Tax=Pempheris klunzingeri TaxID=3127111 RepID=UPI0039803EFB
MESGESKVSVWVCQEEKLVSGLSKRTTCADVVKVLLEERSSQRGLSAASPSGRSQPHCIVEKWRGFERILPNKTKILRLWVAWGEEQRNVKFVLVKSEASLTNHGARSAEARVVLSKHSPCVTKGTARAPVGGISPGKQRRIVRKAFRKLEKLNKKRAQVAHRDASSAEKMETLAHLVISQDHTIRQQVQRITELDAEIEKCEAKVHFERMKRHGINYVQDTYLVDTAAAREGDKVRSADALAKFEEHVRQCEEVVRLQEELWEHEALIEILSMQMQEELNHRWMQRRRGELQSKDAEAGEGAPSASGTEADTASEHEPLLEGERIRTQLDASLYIGLRLNTDLEAIRNDLELTQEICGAREKEMRDLLEKVNTLGMEEEEEETASEERRGHGTDDKTGMMSTLEGKSEWVEQARGLSKAHSGNDDDSDTGLSSLHSQDSDGHPVWESLV